MPTRKLKCLVTEGPLAHEKAVFVDAISGLVESWADQAQVFVQGERENVSDRIPGLLDVLEIQRNEDNSTVLVQLPREVVMGSRRIWVNSDLVS